MSLTYSYFVPEKITNVSVKVVEGGELEPDTTYYLTLVRNEDKWLTNHIIGKGSPCSQPSDEVVFKTTRDNRAVKIEFDGGSGYIHILISKISGDYGNTLSANSVYGTYGLEALSDYIESGYVFKKYKSDSNYATHFLQLSNKNTIRGIKTKSPNIRVEITGSGNLTFLELYNNISINYPESVYYDFDSKTFSINGTIKFDFKGKLITRDETINIIHGYIDLGSNTILESGYDYYKNVGYKYTNWYFFSTRLTFYVRDYNTFKIYGGIVDSEKINNQIFKDNNYIRNLDFSKLGSLWNYMVGYFDIFKADILNTQINGGSRGTISNLNIKSSNNFIRDGYIDCKFINTVWLSYYEKYYKKNAMYRCEFLKYIDNIVLTFYEYKTYSNHMYDMINIPVEVLFYNYYNNLTYDGKLNINYSIRLNIKDENNNKLDGVKVTITSNGDIISTEGMDKNNNLKAIDDHNVITYSNTDGEFWRYIKVQEWSRGPDKKSQHVYYGVSKTWENLEIILEKNGFITQKITIDNLLEPIYSDVFMIKSQSQKITTSGNLLIVNTPEKGIKSNLTEI